MKTILIIEDQPDVRKLLEIILRSDDRAFTFAENGEDALKMAAEIPPDLVLLDLMLPGDLDGYDVCRAFKNDPSISRCPVVFMTAKVQDRDRLDAFSAGADDYIGKPFDIVKLKNIVNKYLH